MAGTDHWYGINQTCPHGCGAAWGGSIPEGHRLGCPSIIVPTQDTIARQNAENARVRAANAAQLSRVARGEA